MKDNTSTQVDIFVKEVDRLLPYPRAHKAEALEELRIDVLAAMEEEGGGNPTSIFGEPRVVAQNLTQSHEWFSTRSTWVERLLAFLVDGVVGMGMVVTYFGIWWALSLLFFGSGDDLTAVYSDLFEGVYQFPKEPLSFLFVIFIISTASFIFFFYIIGSEKLFGTTPGKRLFRLVVVDKTGVRITWRQAIIRNLSKILVGEFLPFDLIIGLALEKQDPEKTKNQRALDIIAETIVVKIINT